MGESFSKKDKANKKAREKREKEQKMKDRKTNNDKGKSLEDMLAYVDEDGNLSSTPPGTRPKNETTHKGAQPAEAEAALSEGTVTFFNESRGFGFITEDNTKANVFFHTNQLSHQVKEKDRVSFEKE